MHDVADSRKVPNIRRVAKRHPNELGLLVRSSDESVIAIAYKTNRCYLLGIAATLAGSVSVHDVPYLDFLIRADARQNSTVCLQTYSHDVVCVTFERMDERPGLDFSDTGKLVGCTRCQTLTVAGKLDGMNGITVNPGKIMDQFTVFDIPDEYFSGSTWISATTGELFAIRTEVEGSYPINNWRGRLVPTNNLIQFPFTRNIPNSRSISLGDKEATLSRGSKKVYSGLT